MQKINKIDIEKLGELSEPQKQDTKGIAWLVNNQALNSHFTPRRLQLMSDNGFTLKSIKVVADKRWFGRYYYLIFTKEPNNFISWERKAY